MDLQKLRKLAGIVESSAPKKKMLKESAGMNIPAHAARVPESSVSVPIYLFIVDNSYMGVDMSQFVKLFGYKSLHAWADKDEMTEDTEFFGLSEEETRDLIDNHFPQGSDDGGGLSIYTTTGDLEGAANILKKSKFQVVITFD